MAIVLGYIFENQNVAFMVGLAFAVAASCNFPVLLMSMFWKGTTTRGVLVGGFLGLASAVAMVVLSPAVWVKTFGFKAALFPYDNPALFSMAIAFGGIWLFSKLDASQRGAERAGRLRGAVPALGDRYRRGGRGRALTHCQHRACPAIRSAQPCRTYRDGRDKPGHDNDAGVRRP